MKLNILNETTRNFNWKNSQQFCYYHHKKKIVEITCILRYCLALEKTTHRISNAQIEPLCFVMKLRDGERETLHKECSYMIENSIERMYNSKLYFRFVLVFFSSFFYAQSFCRAMIIRCNDRVCSVQRTRWKKTCSKIARLYAALFFVFLFNSEWTRLLRLYHQVHNEHGLYCCCLVYSFVFIFVALAH